MFWSNSYIEACFDFVIVKFIGHAQFENYPSRRSYIDIGYAFVQDGQ
jgi:hypothetical protein